MAGDCRWDGLFTSLRRYDPVQVPGVETSSFLSAGFPGSPSDISLICYHLTRRLSMRQKNLVMRRSR